MKKFAVFVEGQTEQFFIEHLLDQVAGRKSIAIEKRQAYGGQTTKRKLKLIQAAATNSDYKYYVQIVDCGSDNRVKSDVVENYEGLVRQGFEAIIAVRDVYPEFTHAEIPKLRNGLRYGVKTKPVEVTFILGVMEIETWFIGEATHFERMDASLTVPHIRTELGFDPSADDIQLRAHPAKDLHAIYCLAGLAYNKSRNNIQRTVNVLDYDRIYMELGSRIPDLGLLNEAIDQFLA